MGYFNQLLKSACFTIFLFMLISFASANSITIFADSFFTVMAFIGTILYSFMEMELIKY